jgi:hypothetical protein
LLKKKNGPLYAAFVLDFYHFRAFVTRYISYEGMPIREGAAENQFYSDKPFDRLCWWRYKREMKRFEKKLPSLSVTNNHAAQFADTTVEWQLI